MEVGLQPVALYFGNADPILRSLMAVAAIVWLITYTSLSLGNLRTGKTVL